MSQLHGLVKEGALRLVLNPDDEDLDGWEQVGGLPEEVPVDFAIWDGTAIVGDLARLKDAKLAAISERFGAEVANGCGSPKGRVDCDDKAQGRIANVIELRERAIARGLPVDPIVKWTMLDKSQVDHDDADLIDLGLAIGFGFAAKFARKQQLEGLVGAAFDCAALDAINIDENWPA